MSGLKDPIRLILWRLHIFVKSKQSQQGTVGELFHIDLFGLRTDKYEYLVNNSLNSIQWQKLEPSDPYFFFTNIDLDAESAYQQFFGFNELSKGISGIETKRDNFAIDFDEDVLRSRISDFVENDYESDERKKRFGVRDNEWVVDDAVTALRNDDSWKDSFVPCLYRPFDVRTIIYSGTILARDRGQLMASMNRPNYGLVAARQTKEGFAVLVTRSVCTHKIVTVYDRSFIFPLYIYPSTPNANIDIDDDSNSRRPNLDPTIIQRIASAIELTFLPEAGGTAQDEIVNTPSQQRGESFCPLDVFDYVYAVLYSPNFQSEYQQLLKIGFPRIPIPQNREQFWNLVVLGAELRTVHLLDGADVDHYVTSYPKDGDNTVTRRILKRDWEPIDETKGRIWINDDQYFDGIPTLAWEFFIGGYQPAQKWLKDRVGRELSYDDILHYQRIIAALLATDTLASKIDKVRIPPPSS